MSYEFTGISYNAVEDALVAVAGAWIGDIQEALGKEPEDLAAECIEEWDLQDLLADWGADAAALADAMEIVIEAARAETGAP
jgi:hypothetical protein